MSFAYLGDVTLHWRQDGDPAGAPVVFAHALGLDQRLWDAVIPLLPQGLRLIRYDLRGHGRSDCPAPPYAMGALISEDGSTPPDLVRETAGLIRGAQFELIQGAGHLPPVDRPQDFAQKLNGFLTAIGRL